MSNLFIFQLLQKNSQRHWKVLYSHSFRPTWEGAVSLNKPHNCLKPSRHGGLFRDSTPALMALSVYSKPVIPLFSVIKHLPFKTGSKQKAAIQPRVVAMQKQSQKELNTETLYFFDISSCIWNDCLTCLPGGYWEFWIRLRFLQFFFIRLLELRRKLGW